MIQKNIIMNQLINKIYLTILCFFIFFGYSSITFSEKIICIVLGGITLILSILQKNKKLLLTTSTKIFFLFIILSALSIAYTISFTATIYTLFLMVVCFAVKIYFENTKLDNKIIDYFIKIILIFSGIHVFSTLIYFIDPGFIQKILPYILTKDGLTYNLSLYKYGCIAGIVSDHGINAIFISVFISILSVFILKKFNLKYLILFILGWCALLLTGKRGPLLANFIAFIILFILINKNDSKKVQRFILFCFLVLVSIGTIKFVPSINFTFERFQNAKSANQLLNGRENSYKVMIDNFNSHFVLGTGLRSTLVINNNNDGHNIYLQLLSESGIIGFTICIIYFIHNLQITRKKNSTCSYISLFYQIWFLIYGFSGNPFYYLPTLLIYLLFTNVYFIEEDNL